jgi:hypothetical protein
MSAFSIQDSVSTAFQMSITKAKEEDVTADEEEASRSDVKLEDQ